MILFMYNPVLKSLNHLQSLSLYLEKANSNHKMTRRAPFSELYGRRLPLVIGAFGFGIFAIAVATAKDLQTVMIGRFFGGLFGSCPLAVVAAAFADMFNNKVRGLAVAVFAACVFMGPLMAPFVSFFFSTLSLESKAPL